MSPLSIRDVTSIKIFAVFAFKGISILDFLLISLIGETKIFSSINAWFNFFEF